MTEFLVLFAISFVIAAISMIVYPEPVCVNFLKKVFRRKK